MIHLLSLGKNPISNYRPNQAIIEQLDRGKIIFMFISYVFDVHKWCLFLASTGENHITPTIFKEREKLLNKILIAV